MARTKVKVDSERSCKGCSRTLTDENELYTSEGEGLGWCGFCKPNSTTPSKISNAKTTLNFGRDLTVKVGATAARSFRKSVEPFDSQLRLAAEAHAERLAEWPAFTRETFARLYDERNLKPLPDLDVSTWGNQAAGVLEKQPEWPVMREAAQAHKGIASETGARLSDAVATAMGVDKLPEDGPGANDPRDVEAMKEALRGLLKDQGLDDDEVEAHPAMEEAQTQTQTGEAIRQQLGGNLTSSVRRGVLRKEMKSIAADAEKKAEAARACHGMGIGTEDGGNGTEDVPMELINQIARDPLMLKILAEIGRMQQSYVASGKAVIGEGNCDVIGVRPDDNIGRLLPFERAKLVHSKHSRLDLISRVMEKRATCWELEGEEPREKGDLVLCVDRSGSMSGDTMIWARAVAGAMMALAVKQDRRVALVMFDHAAVGTLVDSKNKLSEGFKLLSLEPAGGTNVDEALRVAVQMVPDLREPDIVVISDGHFHLDDQYAELAKDDNGRLLAVMLGGASLDDKRFDKIWEPNLDDGDAVGILAEVTR